jgi:alpha-tubulin suppressor-like RCC1 family protein
VSRAVSTLLAAAAILAAGALPAQATPVPEQAGSDWLRITAGHEHTCAIRAPGRLYCWGGDSVGQLGNGSAGPSTTAVPVAGGHTDWVAVDAGGYTTCALRRTGRLYCWGFDDVGQLGDDQAPVSKDVPTQVAGSRTDWASVSVGIDDVCAVRRTGRLFCWGTDLSGRLGNGPQDRSSGVPVQVAGARTDWTSVSVGLGHSCARRRSGRLFCWGEDGHGQLGLGQVTAGRSAPAQVAGGGTDWRSVTAGIAHTCARRQDRTVWCWGSDEYGQVGNADAGGGPTPVRIAAPADGYGALDAGGRHSCARSASHHLYCWGANESGQLTGGIPFDSPIEVGGTDWAQVVGGANHTCAITVTRRAFCWGANGSGQLGDGTPIGRIEPVEVQR